MGPNYEKQHTNLTLYVLSPKSSSLSSGLSSGKHLTHAIVDATGGQSTSSENIQSQTHTITQALLKNWAQLYAHSIEMDGDRRVFIVAKISHIYVANRLSA